MAEGFRKICNAVSGDIDTSTFNLTRDVFFGGDQEVYDKAETILGVSNFVGGLGVTYLPFFTSSSGGKIIEYANAGSQVVDFLESVEEAVGNDGSSRKIVVTEELIRTAMEDAPLKTQQESVSIPVIQNYVDRILAGETDIPSIKVDGNHRYIASRIVGIDIEIQQWSGGNEEKVIDWVEMFLDFFDWGNR